MEPTKLEENLVLTEFSKQRATGEQPGYKIKLQGELPAGAVTPGNKKDPLQDKHGVLTLVNRHMFDGTAKIVMTGKLSIVKIAAQKESPAYQQWTFRLQNVPQREDSIRLLDLASENGDVGAEVEASFIEKEPVDEDEVKVSEGPELFSDEDEEIERIKAGDDFDDGQDSNVVEGSTADHMLKDKAKAKA